MPAVTLGQLQSALATPNATNSGNYLEPGAVFVQAMNEVGPRVYAMGYWKDLVEEQVYAGADGYISLDRDAESVLSANINNMPQRVFSQFHDLNVLGKTQFLPDRYGLVDMGYHPVKRELPSIQNVMDFADVTPISTLHLFTPAGVAVSSASIAGSTLTVKARDADGNPVNGTLTGTTAMTITFPTPVMFFTEIVGNALPFQVNLLTDAADSDSVIAEIFRGVDVVRYRRFRVGGSRDSTFVHVLVKKAWVSVAVNSDILALGNLSAWKHALLGKMAEDNADLERSTYHWQVCRQMLEDEKEASRGSAIPTLNIDLTSNAGFAIHNTY